MTAAGVPVLHVVTDDSVLDRPDFGPVAQRVVAAGGRRLALHLRGPGTPGGALYRLARGLGPPARAAGAVLTANDRVDLALVLGLPAVQLGARSLPVAAVRELLGARALIGRSVHDPDEAARAAASGADYLVVGTIHTSASHPERPGAGPDRIRATTAAAPGIPSVAIGGITPERVGPALEAGARGVAVLSGVWNADEPEAAVAAYLDALARGRPA